MQGRWTVDHRLVCIGLHDSRTKRGAVPIMARPWLYCFREIAMGGLFMEGNSFADWMSAPARHAEETKKRKKKKKAEYT